jgi:hypothetical protein
VGFENPIVGGTALRIPAIQSPNFETGVRGWIIRQNGDAEFNDLDVRGTFRGQEFVINEDGIFVYDGTPAAGNLIGSWTAAAGTDEFGNAYEVGLSLYSTDGVINFTNSGGDVITSWTDTVHGASIDLGVGGGSASQSFTPPTSGGATWQSGSLGAVATNIFGSNTAELALVAPYNTAHPTVCQLAMFGSSDTQAKNRIDATTQQFNVSGELTAGNLDHGSAQTPAPGAGGGTSTVAVAFAKTFDVAPDVVITPRSTVDPATVTISAYVDSVSTTGFTIRCYRSTNSATNFGWHAYG